jgi:ABC-2 type transport system ATP-binding protein
MAPGADPQVLLRRIIESGALVQRFEMIQPSLHQIFLEKVGGNAPVGEGDAWGRVEEGMTGHG